MSNKDGNRQLTQDGWCISESRTGSRGVANSGKLQNSNFTPAKPVNTTSKNEAPKGKK